MLARDPGHTKALMVKAWILAGQEQADEAIALLQQAIDRGEQPPIIYLDDRRRWSPTAAADESIARRRRWSRAWRPIRNRLDLTRALFGVIRRQDGDDAALAFVRAEADAEADGDSLRRLLAELLMQLDRLDEAERWSSRCVEAEPEDAATRRGA